jgi:hypothetical protein
MKTQLFKQAFIKISDIETVRFTEDGYLILDFKNTTTLMVRHEKPAAVPPKPKAKAKVRKTSNKKVSNPKVR